MCVRVCAFVSVGSFVHAENEMHFDWLYEMAIEAIFNYVLGCSGICGRHNTLHDMR